MKITTETATGFEHKFVTAKSTEGKAELKKRADAKAGRAEVKKEKSK